jgi:hypothetical protein
VLALTALALGLHQATAVWDVAYADARREVTPTEQHVHGLLEQAPVMATAFLLALHWDQARALLPGTDDWPQLRIRAKRRPLAGRTQLAAAARMTSLGLVPYLEEFWRCRRATCAAA